VGESRCLGSIAQTCWACHRAIWLRRKACGFVASIGDEYFLKHKFVAQSPVIQ
jgi:hypothetical protein